MKLLICLIVSSIIFTSFDNFFRKHPYIIYFGALILGVLGSILPNPISSVINRGTLATSLFIIVMYARVLPPKSKLYKSFMSLRAPIAIAASFLIFIHNGKTLYSYINAYILFGAVLKPYEILAAICSAIMFILLLPLTVTSFKSVRKKMNPKKWKSLQKLSYIFYGLIYLHVGFLFGYQIALGKKTYCIELSIYTLIFGIYLVKRVGLYLKNNDFTRVGTIIVAISCIIIFSIYFKPLTASEISVEVATSEVVEEINATTYTDGEYTGEAMGYNGMISLKVFVKDGKIEALKYIDYCDDDEYFLSAWDSIQKQLLNNTSIDDLDAVSGATYSSKGIINAINQALYQK